MIHFYNSAGCGHGYTDIDALCGAQITTSMPDVQLARHVDVQAAMVSTIWKRRGERVDDEKPAHTRVTCPKCLVLFDRWYESLSRPADHAS